jgi:sugar phosphate isomerase/epimerase
MSKLPVALQLYTVRDLSAKDYPGTVAQVAKIGYKWVELAGRPLPLAEMKALFAKLGLKVISGHEGLDGLQKDLPGLIAFYKELGAPYITLPGLPEAMRTEAAFPGLVKSLNQIGKSCKEAGIQFCYHNHNWELEVKIGKQSFFEALYANTDPQNLQSQIDVYWVYFAGQDPAALIKKYAGRCPLIHLKDMPKDFKAGVRPARWAEVGEGQLDMKAVYEASEASGAKAYIVEQDTCERPSIESAKLSFDNLKKAGKI